MDWFDLKNPRVTAREAAGKRESITLQADAGITVRTYVLHWEQGKVVEIESLGME